MFPRHRSWDIYMEFRLICAEANHRIDQVVSKLLSMCGQVSEYQTPRSIYVLIKSHRELHANWPRTGRFGRFD